jgi:amino acid adenylation domain-containing protein/non-ribosomal peptide synthase protein (TIGR01720 family)
LIGLFVNTLALRVRCDADPDFGGLVARVRRVCLDAYGHQDLPFEQVVQALRPERALSHSPLVQVFFDLQNAPVTTAEWPDLRLQPFTSGSELLGTTAKFDLTLTMRETAAGLEANVEYNTDLFALGTVERLVGHLRTLLEAAVADPSRRMDELSLLALGERDRVLASGTPAVEVSAAPLLHELVRRHAATRPDSIAAVWGDRQLTYGALNARANRLARTLRANGVGPEARVGLLLGRSPDLVVAAVAVLKAGGAYVPVDPEHPPERRTRLLTAADVALVVGDASAEPPTGIPLLTVDPATLVQHDPEDLPDAVTADNLAYVIHTSGSTGAPKGVQISHRNLAAATAAWQEAYALTPADRHLQMASATFDVFSGDLARALGSGGTLVLCPRELLLEPARLAALADEQRISCAEFVPVVLRHLIAEMRGGRLPSLRLLVCGADAWPAREYAQARSIAGPGARVLNSYGVTEATIDSTFFETAAQGAIEGDDALAPIGRPFGHTRVYVLDDRGRPTPVGVPGELCLGGAAVGRGYLGQAALTAARFTPDPFCGPGERMYRTGDLARWRPDGDLEFLGRADHQVKIRGHRVEPGEVEAALAAHPDVRAAAVVARTDAPGEARLVGYVVAHDGATATGLADELRAEAGRRLPAYLVPSAIVVVDAFPLTPNGKLDRRALPAPPTPEPCADAAPPDTPAEQAIAAVWAEVLGLAEVGIEDNFFALGGDSIVSLQVVARTRTAGWMITPKQVFEHQTVRALAAAARPAGDGQVQTGTEQGIVTGTVPLTPIQAAFLTEQRPPNPRHYNQAMMLRARRPLDGAALEAALQQVVRHHDALRLHVVRTDRGWRQEQSGLEGVPERLLRVVDLRTVPADRRAAEMAHVAEEAQTGLVLDAGCLLSAVHFEPGPDEDSRLLLVVHHLAIDGVSWRILLEDLQRAYQQTLAGDRVQLPRKTTPFRDWALHLHVLAQSEDVAGESAYWRDVVQSGTSALPRDFPGDLAETNTVSTVDVVRVGLSEEDTWALLRDVPAAYHTRINDALLCALAQSLAPWLGDRKLCVELESHGREDVPAELDLSRTVGWLTSFHPVLLDLGPDGDQGAMLKRIKERLRTVPRGGLGYGLLRYLAEDPRVRVEHRTAPRPDVAFNYLGQFDQSFRSEALWEPAPEPAGPMHEPHEPRENLVDVTAVVSAGRLEIAWGYSTAVHRESTITAVAERFVDCLRRLVAHCRTPAAGGHTPSDFPLSTLDQTELDRVLAGAGEVEDVYPLSPMQEGMLFHTAHEPGSGIYVEQFSCRLVGPLDAGALRSAWQDVVDRHPALRTSFHWTGIAAPVQVVHRAVEPAWVQQDWRSLTPRHQRVRLAALFDEDRARGFDLERPPLLRFALVRLADDAHQFLFSHHHLLLDGWSFPQVLSEVHHAYMARLRGEPITLRPAPPFRDYIAWLLRQDAARAERHWRGVLAGYVPPPRLTWGEPPADGAEGTARRQVTLSADTTAALDRLARQYQVTLNTVVQAGWALLLSRYAGTKDVVFGMTVSGRSPDLPGVEDMVGLLINTVPVRARIPSGVTLGDWLRRLQAQLVEARQYEYAPLSRIHGWSGVPRDTPLFESLVVFENYPVEEAGPVRSADVRMREAHNEARTNYPLTLTTAPGRELPLQLWYGRGRFTQSTVAGMLGNLCTLLEGMATGAEEPADRLEIMTGHERHGLLRRGHSPLPGAPVTHAVHELFAEQAARTPDAVALASAGGVVTYAELETRANRLAHQLRGMGVGAEHPVAILQRRSVDLVVSTLAVLKASGAYVPLNARSPDGRLASILAASRAEVVLTDTASAARAANLDATVLVVDADAATAGQPNTDPGVPAHPDQLAYVMHTSGSTGVPKGVAVAHRDVVSLALDSTWRSGNQQRVLLHSPHAFDASTYELWVPLLSGGTLVLAPPADPDVAELAEVIVEQAVTGLYLTAGLFRLLVDQQPGCFARVCEVWSGGDVVPPATVRRVLDTCPDLVVVDVYGPTETTTFATRHRMRRGDELPVTVPIGRPMDGMRVYVLDADLRLVPPGVTGELYLAGAGLARGYLDRPAATADRFVPEPFASPGSRMYRTGDLVRWNGDGDLEFAGRVDEQVKLRGFRVEPGEIEAALRDHPAVREAVALVREDTPGDRRLVAYMVPATTVDPGELRRHCSSQLPDYMVPATFVSLETLPLTANAKIDRAALPAPDRPPRGAHVPPQTPVQSVIVGVWEEVLGVPRVGIHDNFFDLGGHSMVALRLTGRLQETLGRGVSLAGLYRHPTPAALAAAFERPREDWPPAVIPLRTTGSRPPLFCVHPKNGTVFCFTALARTLTADRPVYGIQAHSLEETKRPHASIEEMAAAYLPDILRVQPDGPYHLCGYSLGGLIAYELARLLRERGHEVATLVLLDSSPELDADLPSLAELDAMDEVDFLVSEFAEHLPVTEEMLRGLPPDARLPKIMELARAASLLAEHMDLRTMGQYVDIARAHTRAALAYRPRPYAGSALLLRSAGPDAPGDADPTLGWGRLVDGDLDVRVVPGTHITMMDEPHLAVLVEHLRVYLGRSR